MKKLVLFATLISLGFFRVNAQQPFMQGNNSARPPGLTVVHINMIVLGQAATSTNGGTNSLHFTQNTIADNDILGLINDEFGTSFSTTNGDQLAISNFSDGNLSCWVPQIMFF